ncbi:hypothetical protein GTCCBUS3UF5_4200 [Geobacillus thermoleovorans CCB_US3_UF5]|nr:hypothetical protein GTCCBUS3UF5_4200 [Geobacillus thermoleovorans CCB_US3_UF5]
MVMETILFTDISRTVGQSFVETMVRVPSPNQRLKSCAIHSDELLHQSFVSFYLTGAFIFLTKWTFRSFRFISYHKQYLHAISRNDSFMFEVR